MGGALESWRGATVGVDDVVDLPVDGGDGGEPPEPPQPPPRWEPGPRTPRRGYVQYLPYMGLAAGFIALERVAMITMVVGGLAAGWYAAAALTLLAAILVGVFVGGRAFYQAWNADCRGR
jgi:hypothetical protein